MLVLILTSNFKKIFETAKWTGVVDVFVVSLTEHPYDVTGGEPHEEELCVERNLVSFADEDVNFDYHNTPPKLRCGKGGGYLCEMQTR